MAKSGDIDGALSRLQKIEQADSSMSRDAILSNDLCWYGGLWGRAKDVILHCERAVALSLDDAGSKDSRGVSRAQTGDLEGAIEDFRAFVAWAEDPANGQHDLIPKRQAWIQALQQDRNPFDAETLTRLREEEF